MTKDTGLITTTADLTELCSRLSTAEFLTVDTEFMRESTFWPILCLIQVADDHGAHAIDPLSPDIDLAPLFELLQLPGLLKVFHAARQDIEIFHHLTGVVPAPLFDTQIAAMVCGFGESVSYETLVTTLAGARLDKSARFTDWSRRPLSPQQLTYALGDVSHLRVVFRKLRETLEANGRLPWLADEMAVLADPATYVTHPENAWLRLKFRPGSRRHLATVQAMAAWREREAQGRNVPRNRIMRDDLLVEVAASRPRNGEDLERVRGLSRGYGSSDMGKSLLAALRATDSIIDEDLPKIPKPKALPGGIGPVVELLKVLMRLKCEESGVAPKLIASIADLEQIAAFDDPAVPALSGWRREVFGEAALALKQGKLALSLDRNQIVLKETA